MSDWTLDYQQAVPGLLSNLGQAQQQQADQSGSALSEAMQLLRQQQSGAGMANVPLMAFAAGLGQPTKTGSFAESLSNGMLGAIPQISAERERQLQRQEILLKLQMAKASLGTQLAEQKLKNAEYPMQALGTINQGLGNQQDIDFTRARMNGQVPGLPPVGPGAPKAAVPQAITGGGMGGSGRPAPAAPAAPQAPATAPMTAPVPPNGGGGGPTIPPSPISAPGGAAPQVQPAVADGNQPPPVQTAAVTAPQLPPPPPATPAPADFAGVVKTPIVDTGVRSATPQPVDLGGGVIGYRYPPAISRQLDAATQMAALAQGPWAGSARAMALANSAMQWLKPYMEKGYVWDTQHQALVPVGEADPRVQQALQYSKKFGERSGLEDARVHEVPTGPYGTGPSILVPGSAAITHQPMAGAGGSGGAPSGGAPSGGGGASGAPGSNPPVGGAPATVDPQKTTGMMVKPSVMDQQRVHEIATKLEPEARTALMATQQAQSQLNTVKEILSKYGTGKWAEHKADILNMMRSAGFDTGGLENSGQNFEILTKNAINQVFANVKQIGGRVLASEIAGLQKAVFSAEMQPESNRELVASITAANRYVQDYSKAFIDFTLTGNPNYAQFEAQWIKDHPFQAYKNEEITTTVAKDAKPITPDHFQPPAQPSVGQVINFPYDKMPSKNPDGSSSMKPVPSHQLIYTANGWEPYSGSK